MSNPNWIVVEVEGYLDDCPPHDKSIDQSLIPEIAEEIIKRFDFRPIYDQIDIIACQVLRERGLLQ
jgi:hypothetical protein